MHRTYCATIQLSPVKTSELRRISSLALLLASVALSLSACKADKPAANADTIAAPTPQAASGKQTARGGVSYSTSPSGAAVLRAINTCRSSVSAGVTTVQLGPSSTNLPLTIVQDATGPTSLQFNSPDGLLTFNHSTCTVLRARTLPPSASAPSAGPSTLINFECSSGEKTVQGSAAFSQCME